MAMATTLATEVQTEVSQHFDDWIALESSGCIILSKEFRENEREIDQKMISQLSDIVRKTLKPRPKMHVDECSDKFRYIPQTQSADFGKFRVARYEIGRGPMMAVTERGVRVITVSAATQLMKTTFIESVTLYFMIIEPAPIIVVQPNKKSASVFSTRKLDQMIDYTPEARAIMMKSSIDVKAFTGGDIRVVTAASEADLSMLPRRVALCDEINKFSKINGSDPVALVEERVESYGDRSLCGRVCSPEFEDSPIEESFRDGDMRLPFVACPKCGMDQVMRWSRVPFSTDRRDRLVRWDEDPSTGTWNARSIRYHCADPACDHPFTNVERLTAISRVEWRQTKPFSCCSDRIAEGGGYQEPEKTRSWVRYHRESDGRHVVSYATCRVCAKRTVDNHHASFGRAGRLYSPKPLSKLVNKWKEAQGVPSKLKVFVNSHLAEPWRDLAQIVFSAAGLATRAESYVDQVPARVALLTCGVDVQDTWLEVEVVGWGRGYESWSIEHIRIEGDTSVMKGRVVKTPNGDTRYEKSVWERLDDVLYADYLGANGAVFKIEATCVDSGGHRTSQVYAYCKARLQSRVWARKGWNENGRNPKPVWPANPTFGGAMKVPLYMTGTISAKDDFYAFLGRATPGPGYVHFPVGRSQDYYLGLLGERRVKVQGGGHKYEPKPDVRNEPLDCRVMSYEAVFGLCQTFKDSSWVDHEADRMNIPKYLTKEEADFFDEERKAMIEGENARIAGRQARKKVQAKAVDPAIGTDVASDVPDQLQSGQSERAPAESESPLPARRFPQVARRSGAGGGRVPPPGWR